MADEGREERVVLGFELQGRENAEAFERLGSETARAAEETARRVTAAGDRLASSVEQTTKRVSEATRRLATDAEKNLNAFQQHMAKAGVSPIPIRNLDDISGLLGLLTGGAGGSGGGRPTIPGIVPSGIEGALPKGDWIWPERLRKPTFAPTDAVMEAIGATGLAVAGWPEPGSATVAKWALLGTTFDKVRTQAGKMLVDTKSGFYKWKKALAAASKSATGLLGAIKKLSVGSIAAFAAVTAAANTMARAALKAFKEAEQAAQKRGMREALMSMGAHYDVESGRIVQALIRISDQTLSTAQAIYVTNQALIAGARPFAESVPKLFQIARASAVATGKDVMWVFDTLVRGIARAEPRLIDNANIYLSVTEAAREMAEADGRVYEELDRVERMVYALNAVLQEGDALINSVSQEALDAQQPFQEFRGELDDLKQAFWAAATAGEAIPALLHGISEELRDAQYWAIATGSAISATANAFYQLKDALIITRLTLALVNGESLKAVGLLKELYELGREGELGRAFDADIIGTWVEEFEKANLEGKEAIAIFEDLGNEWRTLHRVMSEGPAGAGPDLVDSDEGADAYASYLEKLYRIDEDAYRDRLEANRDFADDLLDLENDLADDRADVWQDYYDEIADIERDYAERVADAQEQARDLEQDALDDYNDGRADALRDHTMALIRIERDYREEVLRIEEDYQMSLADAVAERDATAALKARRQRRLQLKRASRDRDRSITEENEDYAAQLADLKRSYDERRAEAEEYRRDELREAAEWRAKERAEAERDRNRELRDLQEMYREKLDALVEHHGEVIDEILEEYKYERALAEIEYTYRENAYAAHLQRMRLIQERWGGAGAPGPDMGVGAGDAPGLFPDWFGTVPSYGAEDVPPPMDWLGDAGDSLEQYEDDLARIEGALADLTDTSSDSWQEQLDLLVDSLGEQSDEQEDHFEDIEGEQQDHQRDRLELLNRYFRDDEQLRDRYNRRGFQTQQAWQDAEYQYARSHYTNLEAWYNYHLLDMEQMLYNYWLTRRLEQASRYYNEITAARDHYQMVEDEYLAHLQQLWLIYNLYGTPPAPTPGVPEVVGKYAAETSAARSHYATVERMYQQHLRNLWHTYNRVGVPGTSGREIPLVDGGGRAVPQPSAARTQLDLSSINLNHAVSVAIRSELAGLDGQITNQVTNILGRIFR